MLSYQNSNSILTDSVRGTIFQLFHPVPIKREKAENRHSPLRISVEKDDFSNVLK
jgi:hypothetical protein